MSEKTKINEVTAVEVSQLLKKGEELNIIATEHHEMETGKMPRAIHIP
ncbi:hypothetical protein [Bacillus glycinifermentans]|nr:hypothetical protein [Bacillus glycinifermentans]UOY89990.1 hypothetical protein MW696_07150 [Bacillus glycinifermentans]